MASITVIMSSRWSAPTRRPSIIWYLIMPKLFSVCECASQLFLVNPDQLARQDWATDTEDLKVISGLAASSISSPHLSLLCVSSLLLLSPLPHGLLSVPTGLTWQPQMTPLPLFDTVLVAFLSTQLWFYVTLSTSLFVSWPGWILNSSVKWLCNSVVLLKWEWHTASTQWPRGFHNTLFKPLKT